MSRLKYIVLPLLLLTLIPIKVHAGWIEERDGKTIIHVKLNSLPDPADTNTSNLAACAVVKNFLAGFSKTFAEKYRSKYSANPEKYGKYNWDNVEVELHRFSGISIQGVGMDSKTLMAIAGGVPPDVLYVNFRQSSTYINGGFFISFR